MLYLPENLKKYRILKNLTQEDVAEYLGITPQSVSKWERGESYPDITLLPALANILALKGNTDEAIELMERGLPISMNEKQKATMRATLCFLYLKAGYEDKANRLASELPHKRESREVIQPLIRQGLSESEINENIKNILLGDGKGIW